MSHFQQPEQRCCQCDSDDQLFVSLSCQHSFCIVCMCYVMIKSKTKKTEDNLVTCPICSQTTTLDTQSIQAIQHTIENIILPKLSNFSIEELSTENIDSIEEYQKMQGRSVKKESGETNVLSEKFTVEKPSIKVSKRFSEDPSYDHFSPTTNKYFFSKCMTPVNNSRDSFSNKECCSLHPMQEITSVCLTCQNQIVCTKCLLTTKHKGHNVKALSKGIEFLVEEINFKKLDVNHKVENLELNERRIKGKLSFLKERLLKSQENISESFDQLICQIKRRQSELHNECLEAYQALEDELQQELAALSQQTSVLNFAKDNLEWLMTSVGKPFDFLKSYNQVFSLMNTGVQYALKPHVQFQQNNYLQISEEDLAHVFEEINQIGFEGKRTQVNKMMAMSTKNVASFVSCNTSRQKQKKKGLKTEGSINNLMKKKPSAINIPKIHTDHLQEYASAMEKQIGSRSLFYTDRSVDASKNITLSKNSISKMLSSRNLLEVEKRIRPLEKEKSEKKHESKEFGRGQKVIDVKRKKRV